MTRTTGNRRVLHLLTALCITGLGLYLSGLSLWRLVQTATFMRTSSTVIAVVEDVRQRPFESISEALAHGNLAWGGSTAYQPITAFTIADGRRVRLALPDLNSDDYAMHSELEVRVPANDFTKAREYRNSALWGGTLADLLIGLLCTWLGWILLKIRKRTARRQAEPARPAESATGRPTPPARGHQEPKSRGRDPQAEQRPARRTPAKTTGKNQSQNTASPTGKSRRPRSSAGTRSSADTHNGDTPKSAGRRRQKKTT